MAKPKNKRPLSGLKIGLKKHGVSILFATPFMLLFLVFTIIPVFMAFLLSFTNYNILEPATFVGLRNYLFLFLNDNVFAIAIKNAYFGSVNH